MYVLALLTVLSFSTGQIKLVMQTWQVKPSFKAEYIGLNWDTWFNLHHELSKLL